MSYEYRGFDLNEYLEEPWYATEQTAFTDILDFLPEKGETIASGHYHSYIASASDEANLAVSANNDGTVVLNQYTTDGVLQVCGGAGEMGATGISAEIVGSGNISQAEFETLNGVETGIQAQIDATDATMGKLSYFAGLGVTGVPVWGDGFVEDYLENVGTAVYSANGSVYFLGEAGFTGTVTLAGCHFVITPVADGDNIKFVSTGADADDYSALGFTGSSSVDDSELSLVSSSGDGTSTSHLLLKATYGKVKLSTGAGGGGENGIVLTGADTEGVNYTVAAASNYRDLYADENGDVVVGESDNAQRYKTAGFTAIITDTYMDVETYSYITYELIGKSAILHLEDLQANSVSTQMVISNMPTVLQSPSGAQNVPCIVHDRVNAPSGYVRPGTFYTAAGANGTFQTIRENATSGEQEYFNCFGDTGIKGWPAQTIVLRVNA